MLRFRFDCVAVILLAPLLGHFQDRATAQGWEVDWGAVSRISSVVAEGVQASPFADQIAAMANSVEVDWEQVGRLIGQVLGDTSWEDAAALRPYAEAALKQLAAVDGGEPVAVWFRQRLDYLLVAEEYVNDESAQVPPEVPPPPRPVPSPPRPAPRVPAPRKRTTPAAHVVSMDQDTKMWIRRLPAEPVPAAQRLAPSLRRIFEAEGVPPALIWLAEVESAFNPNAKSPVGAAGLYQFMPATAGRFGLSTSPVDQRLEPERSAEAAARYLRLLYTRFSDWPLALAAYNAGEGRVGRTLRQNKGARSFEDIAGALPLETRMYVPRIAAVVRQREGVELSLLPAPSKR